MSFIAGIEADINRWNSNLDKAQARFDRFAQEVGQKVAALGSTFQNIGGVLSIGLTAPLVALGAAALKSFGQIESLTNGLNALTGSTEETQKQLDRLIKLTDIPGLSLEALVKGSINLQTIGFSAEKAEKSMRSLGNAIALVGGGQQDFEGALYGLQQLANTEFPLGEDLNILKERLPQITPLLKEAFGTARTEDLQKLKVTSEQVVDTIINGLGKLPQAATGLSGAFTILQNSVSLAMSELGKTINETFNITGAIQSLTDKIKGSVEWFKKLSPETQKLIVVIGGVVAAIGPFLVALGSIMQLAPLVGTAFATMTGPIGITVVAIGAAVALIIKYWDEIKAYFTSGGGSKIWENISSGAQKLWKNLVDIFNSVRSFITAIWDKIGSNVMTIVGNSFETVFAIISSVIGQIVGVLTVFTSLIKGDFSGAFEAAKNVVKGIFNAIRTIVINVISNVSNAIAGFLKLIGADSLGNSLEGWAKGLKPVKEQTEQVAVKVEEVATKVENQTKKVVENTTALGGNTKAQKDFRGELNNTLASWGIYEAQVKVLNTTYQELDKTAKAAKATQEEFQTIMSRQWADKALLNFEKIGENAFKGSNITKLSNGLNMPIELNPVLNNGKFEKVVSNLKSMAFELAKSFNEGFNEIINTSIADSIAEIAASIGGALASGDNLLKSVGSAMLGTLGGVLTELGKMAIQTGIGIKAIQLALKSLNPYVAIAAGVALVALGSAFKSGASSLAGGGAGNANSSAYSGSSQSIQNAFPRGSYYNNEKQEVELKLRNGELKGAIKWGNNRNNRLG